MKRPSVDEVTHKIRPDSRAGITFFARSRCGEFRLSPYGRLDIYTDYRLDKMWRVFARVENVTDTRYQEVLNYGTTGRAIYGGFNATW